MTQSTSQPHQPPSQGANGWLGQRRWHRLGALLFLALGGLLLAANLRLLSPAATNLVGWVWPLVVLAAGVWLVWAGRAAPAANFSLERGDYTAGELGLSAGTADFELRALPAGGALAEGWLPAARGPEFAAEAGKVCLRMTPRLAVPGPTQDRWSMGLSPDLPWTLHLRSSLGNMALDLRDLPLTTLQAHSDLGHIDLTLPAHGQAEVGLRLGLGNLTLRVPEGMAVKVKISRGRLATLRPEARRFVELAPGEWATPLFAVSPARCTVTVTMWAGDLTLV
jgi:hypothetical protein